MAREAPDRGWGAWGRAVRPAVVARKAWKGAALVRGGEEDRAMHLIGITQKKKKFIGKRSTNTFWRIRVILMKNMYSARKEELGV
jgi:hypothetical protein